jgi:hypothetical protein
MVARVPLHPASLVRARADRMDFSDHTPLLTGRYVYHSRMEFESSRGAKQRSEVRTDFRTNAYPFVFPFGIPFGLFALFLEVVVYGLSHHHR